LELILYFLTSAIEINYGDIIKEKIPIYDIKKSHY